jgi:hypothetical protein
MTLSRTAWLFIAISAANVFASPKVNSFQIVLYDRVWNVDSYFVQDDVVAENDWTFFQPKGIAFRNSQLFASGDPDYYYSDSCLCIYDFSAGTLTFDHYLKMGSTWGPSGLTFNTSALGYGAGSNLLVSVEADVGEAAVINTSIGAVTNTKSLATGQDITYIPSLSEFASVTGTQVNFFDQSLNPISGGFAVASETNGACAVSAQFGSWFTRTSQSQPIFLFVTDANIIYARDLSGNPVGRQYNLPSTPRAYVDDINEGDFHTYLPAFGSLEGITVDESSKTIFLADCDNGFIHVLTPVRLSADIDNNGTVDFRDLKLLITQWLATGCADPGWCGYADIDHSGTVNLADLASFARQWLAQGP